MKYLTKEWYKTCQETSLHLFKKVSKKAETFSEDYYEKLYESEEKAFLSLWKGIYETPFDDLYPEEYPIESWDDTYQDPIGLEEAKKEYSEKREQARLNYMNRPDFDPEKEKKNFRLSLQNEIEYFRSNLPIDIIQRIADIRVLALDRVSLEVFKELRAYSIANRKSTESTLKAYIKEQSRIFSKQKPDFMEDFEFHDCIVVSKHNVGNDIVLKIDNSGGYSDIEQIILKNCSIKKQDANLDGAWWLYEEIYKVASGYEIHVLLEKKELMDFIVTVTNVEYE